MIGYPNVGKSSVINSLKRSKAVGVGAMPGFTKSLQVCARTWSIYHAFHVTFHCCQANGPDSVTQHVRLDKSIELVDSPGVLFDSSQSEAELVLRNALKVEQVEDPVQAGKRSCSHFSTLFCVVDEYEER